MHVSMTMCQSNCVNKCTPSTRMFENGCATVPGDGMKIRLRERSGLEEVSETQSVYYITADIELASFSWMGLK